MKRLCFCFNFWKKNYKENIALLENKKFGKGCFNLSEHILYLKFFSAAQPWWTALLGIHFRIFVPVSLLIRLECLLPAQS